MTNPRSDMLWLSLAAIAMVIVLEALSLWQAWPF
jgi:hypothetical protein